MAPRRRAGRRVARARVQDDVLASQEEHAWFDASACVDELHLFCQNFRGTRWLEMLDVFAFAKGMAEVAGTRTCVSYDIRLDGVRHDVTTRRGVMLLLSLGMSLVHNALVTCAPPCSLHIWLSSSIHRRHMAAYGPYGNRANRKVRLSNLILLNMVGACDDVYVYM